MLEKFLFKSEEEAHFGLILIQVLITVVALAIVNHFMGGNSVFLVALVSLALAYPVTKYMRKRISEEFHKKIQETQLLVRHDIELIVFWSIFIASFVGFFIVSPLISDFSVQASFYASITGNMTDTGIGFTEILINNLGVLALTFAVSFISIAGLIIVLVWNASVLAYVLRFKTFEQNTFMQAIGYLGHGLLEIAGFVFAGISAMILAYKIEHIRSQTKDRSVLLKDSFLLLLIGIIFVVIAALIETL